MRERGRRGVAPPRDVTWRRDRCGIVRLWIVTNYWKIKFSIGQAPRKILRTPFPSCIGICTRFEMYDSFWQLEFASKFEFCVSLRDLDAANSKIFSFKIITKNNCVDDFYSYAQLWLPRCVLCVKMECWSKIEWTKFICICIDLYRIRLLCWRT